MANKKHSHKKSEAITVLFFSRLFYPHIGGVEKHVYKLSKELLKRGYKVIIITEQFDCTLKEVEVYEGITIYRIPIRTSEKNKKFTIWKWLLLHKVIIKNATIIHCHDVFYWYFPFTLIFPFKKVYVTFHGYEGNKIPTKRSKYMHEIAERVCAGNICIGDFFRKWYSAHPTFVSYGGTDVQYISSRIQLKKKMLKAVFIGRLEEETGILTYANTLVLLKRKNIGVMLEVLGDGSQKELLEQIIISNKLNVQIHGFVKNTESFINKADIVFVSRYLGILDSIAAKKPTYSLYNNAIKEDYLKMAPFASAIVITNSAKNLANAIVEDISNQTYKKRGELGYLWIKTHTWEQLSDMYEKLWHVS